MTNAMNGKHPALNDRQKGETIMLYTVRHYIDHGDMVRSRPKQEFETAKEAIEYANSIEIEEHTDRIVVLKGDGDDMDEEIYIIDSDGDVSDYLHHPMTVTKGKEREHVTWREFAEWVDSTILTSPFDMAHFLFEPYKPSGFEVFSQIPGADVVFDSIDTEKILDKMKFGKTIALRKTGDRERFYTVYCSKRDSPREWTITEWIREADHA